MLWEEHNLYFTPEILKNYFKINFPNMSLIKFFKYKYPIEDALLILLKNDGKINIKKKFKLACPSGLRGHVKAVICSHAWVQTPQSTK